MGANGNDVVFIALLGGGKHVPGGAVLHLGVDHEISRHGTGAHLRDDGLAVLQGDANDGYVWANIGLGSTQSTTKLSRAVVVDDSANGLGSTGTCGLGTKVTGTSLDEGNLALDIRAEVTLD